MDENFLRAVEKTLSHEGGYVADPHDRGGETNFGISKKSYPDLDIRNLTKAEAIEIYHRDWWEKYQYGRITHENIRKTLFDLSVNLGPYKAHALLQFAVINSNGQKITVDGIMGQQTILAVNSHPVPDHLHAAFILQSVRHYVSLADGNYYLKGWLKRVLGMNN